MRRALCAVVCIAGLTWSAAADDTIPPETLAAVKQATVFVKVDVKAATASGSGFVVKKDGNTALVVTNLHVIEPKVEIEAQPRLVEPKTRPKTSSKLRPRPSTGPTGPSLTPRSIITTLKNAVVHVVFDSGTKHERVAKAEVVATDADNDLAALRVKDVQGIPEPIDVGRAPALTETMAVYSFGFPFGKLLATGTDHPAITVGRAAISSLRENDEGEPALVQIDGNLNPGNSGGPIVDARGRLVGVAVATIRNSNGIGLAIPAGQLRKMLDGRLGAVHVTSNTTDGKLTVNLEVGVIDPLNKIASVTFYYLPGSQYKGDPRKPIESLATLPGIRKVTLTLEKQLASGKLVLDGGAQETELLLQAAYLTGEGTASKTKVFRQSLQATAVVKTSPSPGSVSRDGETRIMGGAFDPTFKDQAPDGGLLIGFEVGLGKFAQNDVVNAIRPIYRTAKGEVLGKQYGTNLKQAAKVKAKAGYAVGGITAKAGLLVAGFSVTFMRVKEGKLDPASSYQSDWIGGRMGGPETRLGGDGSSVIGIVGKTNAKDCTGLGLLLRNSDAPPRSGTAPVTGGKEFAPKNQMFTITIPDGETTGQRTRVLSIDRHKVPVEASHSTSKDGTTYVGASVGIPAVVMRDLPADRRFDILRDAILKPLNGRATHEKDIKQDVVVGKEYQIELPDGAARMRLYTVAGFVVYAVVEGKSKEAINTKQADGFFASLKFTQKAKDVFQRVKR